VYSKELQEGAASCEGFVDQAQDYGINAIRSGAGRDDDDQHEGI
jgi:hypothetical protein